MLDNRRSSDRDILDLDQHNDFEKLRWLLNTGLIDMKYTEGKSELR